MAGGRRQAQLSVCVLAEDPLLRAGTVAQLGSLGIVLVAEQEVDARTLVLLVCDTFDDGVERRLGAIRARTQAACVLVPVILDHARFSRALLVGVRGIVWRRDASRHALRVALDAVDRGGGSLPPDLTGVLLDRFGRGPLGERACESPLGARELDVLRLVADGYDTHEIAVRLAYSERTIKAILHDVTSRLGLRNRSHAVAFLIRRGVL
jgi:DNA-binding NarL/FixJ family response regulator